MKIYLYGTAINQRTMHNKLVKEKEILYNVDGGLSSPEKIHKLMTEVFELDRKAEEYLYLIALNTKCKPIGLFEVSHGTVNASLVSPREVYIRALLTGATNIIIAHNHPSKDCTASKEDLLTTRRLKEAGNLIGIKLLDHIIIGGKNYNSLNEKGMI
jgi:DNA repair protein RadC